MSRVMPSMRSSNMLSTSSSRDASSSDGRSKGRPIKQSLVHPELDQQHTEEFPQISPYPHLGEAEQERLRFGL